ncbi:MAG TPA: hypothetical protein VHM20_06005 [Gammaproteobacteria bacterium]|jgi:hypothetical protein|nr:hypothetical protein [Gammaproteobacteria bacterium]
MKNEKKKGGKRAGAGRRPAEVKKEPITIYADISKFGSKDMARMAIYEFLDGKIHYTGKSSFVPLHIPDELGKSSKWPPKKDKPISALKPQEQPKTDIPINYDKEDILKQIAAIRAEKVPKERDTAFGRKAWQMEQDKRIADLKCKLPLDGI